MIFIHSEKTDSLYTGPVMFNQELPGIFMSAGFIQSAFHMREHKKIEDISTIDNKTLSNVYFNTFSNAVYCQFRDIICLNPVSVSQTMQVVYDAEFEREIKDGLIKFNNQIGYYISWQESLVIVSYLNNIERDILQNKIMNIFLIFLSCRD